MTIITKPDGVDAKSPKHFLFAPMPLWGHLRPNIALAANLLSRDPNLLVTFLVPALHAVPASKEFAKHKLLGNERFKIVEYGPRQFEEKAKEDPYMNAGQMVENAVKLPEYFKPIYAQLLTGEVIEDHSTGKPIYPFSAPPTVAIIDSSLCPRTYPVVDYFNNLLPDDKQKVKVVMIGATGSTHSAWYTLETLEEGRVQSYPSRCSKIMDSPPEEREHAYEKWLGSNADVVNLPDCAPIHVYEAQPNQRDVFHPYVQYFLPLLPVVAAYVTIWPAFLGREYNERMVNSGKNVLQIGPQYSPLVEDATSLPTGVLKDFLDTALEEKGRNSVVYISFGTLFCPASPDQLTVLLDVLILLDIRFVLVKGLISDVKYPEIKAKVDKTSTGIMVDWAPQLSVLAHEATGWFLTHGGSNSVMEAIKMRVPMLFWPCEADQVWISNQFTRKLKVGYEFLQVRNGSNIGKRTYTGWLVVGDRQAIYKEFVEVFQNLLTDIRGIEMRRRIQELGTQLEEDTTSERDLLKLLDI